MVGRRAHVGVANDRPGHDGVRVDKFPKTRYVAVGEADVAYQVLGNGPVDLLYFSAGDVFSWNDVWRFRRLARGPPRPRP
jgi:hypothetical protein